MKYLFVLIIITICFINPCYSQTNTGTNIIISQTNDYLGEIIFITMSKACRCVKRRCNNMSNEITKIMTNQKYTNIKLTKIDHSLYRKPANEILNKYKLGGIPIILILNKKDELLYHQSYNF